MMKFAVLLTMTIGFVGAAAPVCAQASVAPAQAASESPVKKAPSATPSSAVAGRPDLLGPDDKPLAKPTNPAPQAHGARRVKDFRMLAPKPS